jgi:DNA excision repair protein ERCC-3
MTVTDAPLIVQSDLTVLIEVASPRYMEARDRLLAFTELVKSPEHVHTYRITPLSIWNACSAGLEASALLETLTEFSRYPLPDNVRAEVIDQASRYGRLVLERGDDGLVLTVADEALAEEIAHDLTLRRLLLDRPTSRTFRVAPGDRGRLKQALIKRGRPVRDNAGYSAGEPLSIELRATTVAGEKLALRDYQEDAAWSFHSRGADHGGNGVIVLPCGAGKTIVGLASMAQVGASTLVLTTSTTAVRQWIAEILDKTFLQADQVGEYSGHSKEIRPVTVATYQILTHRQKNSPKFTHLGLFDSRDWGLIVYDEVHLLPAPIFQITAGLQARRRLGLTATLVREDGREDDVFALIGPKSCDVPWKELEAQGWIAKAHCIEVRLPLPPTQRMEYAIAPERAKARFAAENPDKARIVEELLAAHPNDQALVIGTYVDQLKSLAKHLDLPLLTGSTSQRRRDQLYDDFRSGRRRVLVVSKVANFAVDLPDASLAIQVSGSFGSRQEEAQRLGRLLRPKAGTNQAHFYTLVTRDTKEQEFALRRQLFLCEQGYTYSIRDATDSLRQ